MGPGHIKPHVLVCSKRQSNGGELKAKWLSTTNHIVDVHQGHGDRFPECQHGSLENRKWLKKGNQYCCLLYGAPVRPQNGAF